MTSKPLAVRAWRQIEKSEGYFVFGSTRIQIWLWFVCATDNRRPPSRRCLLQGFYLRGRLTEKDEIRGTDCDLGGNRLVSLVECKNRPRSFVEDVGIDFDVLPYKMSETHERVHLDLIPVPRVRSKR